MPPGKDLSPATANGVALTDPKARLGNGGTPDFVPPKTTQNGDASTQLSPDAPAC